MGHFTSVAQQMLSPEALLLLRAQVQAYRDLARSEPLTADTLAVLYHEAFHQFIFYSVGEVAPHSWFNEGHGDYFSGADVVGFGADSTAAAERRRLLGGRRPHLDIVLNA